MMKYREQKQPQIPVTHCPYCESYDLGIGWQQNEAIVTLRRNEFLGNRLKHVICRNCGTVMYQCGGDVEIYTDKIKSDWKKASAVAIIMRCDSDSGKKLIKSMVLRTADRQGMC